MTKQERTVDTSVAVPLLVANSDAHAELTTWAADFDLTLCGHALAETYSVLTRLPGDARVSPADAQELIDDRFVGGAITFPETLVASLHRMLAAAGIAGGATYDAMIAIAARESGAILVTRDLRAKPTYEALGAEVELFEY